MSPRKGRSALPLRVGMRRHSDVLELWLPYSKVANDVAVLMARTMEIQSKMLRKTERLIIAKRDPYLEAYVTALAELQQAISRHARTYLR